jgi:hypothetical protein
MTEGMVLTCDGCFETNSYPNRRDCMNRPTWKANGFLQRFNVPLETRHCDSCKENIERVGVTWYGASANVIVWTRLPEGEQDGV